MITPHILGKAVDEQNKKSGEERLSHTNVTACEAACDELVAEKSSKDLIRRGSKDKRFNKYGILAISLLIGQFQD